MSLTLEFSIASLTRSSPNPPPFPRRASDPGAADFVRELARDTQATAVLSRYSRLLVDPNR